MTNSYKVGLVFAIILGGWHLVWSILVATGLGQALYDVILWAHDNSSCCHDRSL